MRGVERKYDADQAKRVRTMVGIGLTHDKIAKIERMDVRVLRRLYRAELDDGMAAMEAKLVSTAYNMALEERNATMLIFLLKTKFGYRETNRTEISVGTEKGIRQMSDEELRAALDRLEDGENDDGKA